MTADNRRVLLVLWTSSRCNLKCIYCYAANNKSMGDMPESVAVKALSYFKGRPLKIQFSGGEPMMNFGLIKSVIEEAGRMHLDASFQIQTNGTLIDAAAARFIKKNRIAVGVSLDGIPEINEATRGKTMEVVRGIQNLGREGVIINLNCVVTRMNVRFLERFVDFAFYLGNVAGIGLDLLRCAGKAADPLQAQSASADEIKSALIAMTQRSSMLYEKTGRHIIIREIEEAKMRLQRKSVPKGYCYASCGASFVVLPEGSVYPCGSLAGKADYAMGSVFDKIMPVKLDEGKNATCTRCSYGKVCPGACPSRYILNIQENGARSLDCVLRKTAFMLAEKEMNRDGNK